MRGPKSREVRGSAQRCTAGNGGVGVHLVCHAQAVLSGPVPACCSGPLRTSGDTVLANAASESKTAYLYMWAGMVQLSWQLSSWFSGFLTGLIGFCFNFCFHCFNYLMWIDSFRVALFCFRFFIGKGLVEECRRAMYRSKSVQEQPSLISLLDMNSKSDITALKRKI